MRQPILQRICRTGPALAALAVLVAASCEAPPSASPQPPKGPTTTLPGPPGPPLSGRTVATDRDTFAVSSQPTASRGSDSVLRIMDSQGKAKIGYVSFVVDAPDGSVVDAALHLTPNQSRFAVQVHTSGAFTNATTYATRPTLGPVLGRGSTVAGQRLAIPIAEAPVSGGRINLALTTTSPYELEVVSREGAARRGQTAAAPTLDLDPAPPAGPGHPGPDADRPGWRLTFADEFEGTAVDTSVWNVYDQSRGDTVESPKSSTCPQARNVQVREGKLIMRTQRANGSCTGGQPHAGAGLNTWDTFSQAGGRFEVRGRWTHRGNYLWGGFWTHGNFSRQWSRANASEIDVWEYIGKDAEPNLSRFKPAIHYNYTCDGPCGMQSLAHTGYDVTRWHTYAVEWDPTDASDLTTMQVRFYLDEVLIALFDRAGTWRVAPDGTRTLVAEGGWGNPAGPFPNPFGLDRPQMLVLSAWVGAPGVPTATVAEGYRPSGGHADLEIDYVRVYQR